ncbi:hypothetical protein HF086_005557 [Spodoptera exigua]|uniref:Uncharacterized protein n=1 Tax=Spodoptera exigua TaxID=7107 RepID=A0A922SL21_SPOEX|nr:hypothetical protein HF086_005557 [Spodoptera exigua]
MFTRSARLVKLATKESEEHVMDKNKSIDLNISTSTDIDEETDKRESPLPSGFENQLIKLNELLGDVFNEDDASTKENIEPTAPSSEKIQSTSSTTKNIEPTVSSAENIEPIASTSTHFEIIVDHEITPMPSPSSNEICDDTFCVGYAESENPPILTNDDLYGNLPTPSVTSFSSVYTPTAQSKQTRQPTFKRDKGKKRLIHKENWVVNNRKSLKNQGKSFTNHRGKHIQEKQLKEPCNEKCRLKCSTKFSEKQREIIFKKFWNLGDRQKQWHFVIMYTQKIPKRRQTTEVTKHDRRNTFYYFLPNEDKQKTKVCKTMFLNTISAGERIVTTSWKKYDGEMTVSDDKRGKYIHKANVMDEEMIRSVCDHVKSFSLVESHYIRKDSKKLYLEDVKSASRMFNLYSEWFDSDKYRNKASTKRQYRDILNANFNIGFHKPKKDLCDVCHVYCNKEIPTEEEKSAFLKHQSAKKAARVLKQQDKNEAISNEEIVAATFDFEKVLVTPHGDSLLANKNWSKNSENEKIQWTRLREVTVHALHYDRIEYKYNFEDEPKTIKILISGNRNTERLSREFEIKQAYDGDLLLVVINIKI